MENNTNKMESNTNNIIDKSTDIKNGNVTSDKGYRANDMMAMICDTARSWACSYDENGNLDETETLRCILNELSDFASLCFMPNLFPIYEAVCVYARNCDSEEKVSLAMRTLGDLQELQATFNLYSPTLGILEVVHDKREVMASKR